MGWQTRAPSSRTFHGPPPPGLGRLPRFSGGTARHVPLTPTLPPRLSSSKSGRGPRLPPLAPPRSRPPPIRPGPSSSDRGSSHGSEPAGGGVVLALADGGRRHRGRRQGRARLQARGDLRAPARLRRQHRQGGRRLRPQAPRQQEPPRQAEGRCPCPCLCATWDRIRLPLGCLALLLRDMLLVGQIVRLLFLASPAAAAALSCCSP